MKFLITIIFFGVLAISGGFVAGYYYSAAKSLEQRRIELSEQYDESYNLRAYQIALAADGMVEVYDKHRFVGEYQSDTTALHMSPIDSIIYKDNE